MSNSRKVSKPSRKTEATRRPRPPTIEEVTTADRTPLRSPKPNKDHKPGFRSIFRSKSDKENQSSLEVALILSPSSTKISSKSPINSPTLSENFQSRTIFASSSVDTTARGKPLKINTKKEKRKSLAPTKPSKAVLVSHNTCDPLPLFRVYPQSIKHAKLVSSTLAADTIIRISNHDRNNSLREDISQTILGDETKETKTTTKKSGKPRSKHKRHLSGSISKAEWTEKIYVLVTSGYLLQYAGEGSFDRLPEKMLQLGKQSAVFASDSIAGKHWVLQVSQSIDSNGQPTADSRSLLSRLSFRGADYRRMTTSFLLILENAEEMDAWIAAIRGEIELLGGKKHFSETGKLDDEHSKSFTPPRLVPRNTNRFSAAISPTTEQFQDGLASITSRPLSSIRPSTDSPSISTTATSRDEAFLDNLRDNSHHRLSHLSSGPTTVSQASSPSSSPTRDTFLPSEGFHIRPNAMAIIDRRRSLQTMENPILGPDSDNLMISSRHLQPKSSRPYSTMLYSGPNLSNFAPSPMNDISTTAGRRSLHSTPPRVNNLSTRKRTPPTLSLARPLTPVEDSNSPPSATHAYTPRVDASHTFRQGLIPRMDLPRPQTASAAIDILHKPDSFSKRFSSVADVEVYNLKQFEPLPLPPSRPPPPPPQNLPSRSRTLALYSNPITNSQTPPTLQTPTISTNQYLRRPMSMQVRTNAPPPISFHAHPRPYSPTYPETANARLPPKRPAPSLPLPLPPSSSSHAAATPVPVIQTVNGNGNAQLSLTAKQKQVQNRRSLPQLISGPPLPPPKRALPPLPSGVHV